MQRDARQSTVQDISYIICDILLVTSVSIPSAVHWSQQ